MTSTYIYHTAVWLSHRIRSHRIHAGTTHTYCNITITNGTNKEQLRVGGYCRGECESCLRLCTAGWSSMCWPTHLRWSRHPALVSPPCTSLATLRCSSHPVMVPATLGCFVCVLVGFNYFQIMVFTFLLTAP